jgi:hypothetical protein
VTSPRTAIALTGAVLAGLVVLPSVPAAADVPQTTVDVLKVVDGEYVVETVTVPATSAESTADRLEAAPEVVAASPSVSYQLDAGNDPYWDTTDPQAASAVKDVWSRTRGEGQIVAVLDSAVETTHPDLAGAFVPGTDVVGGPGANWHGTGVAGIVAARAENGIGSAGMAPLAKVMPVRVCNDTGCPSTSIARGILWAADHGADVINMSLSGVGYSDVSAAAVQYALDKNISVLAATGNDGLNGNPVMYPAALSGVIGVSSTAPDGTPSNWAVNGWQTDLSTVGDSTLLTMPGGAYGSGSGTSFSTPAVSGAVALLRAAVPGITPEQVQTALQAGSDSSGTWPRSYGAGRLHVPSALAAAERPDGSVTVTPAVGQVTVSWPAVEGATSYTVRVDGSVRAEVAGTTATVSGLTNGNQVAVDVEPSNGPRSRAVLATVGPVGPGTPTLTGASLRGTTTSAIIDLQASLPSGAVATKYSIIRDGLSIGSISMALTTTAKTFAVGIGAMPTQETRWQIRPVDDLGRMLPASNTVTAGSGRPPAPGGVTGLTAVKDGSDLLLTWDDLGAAYSYRVTVDGVVVSSPVTAGAVVAGPPANASRTYSVSAVDGWGQAGPSSSIEVDGPVTVFAPGAPTIGAPTAGDASATVRWSAPVDDGGSPITGYTVATYRDGMPVGTSSAPADATSLVVNGLTNGRPHTFTVTATNAIGTSAESTASAAVTPTAVTPPSAPGIGTASAGDASATVRWTAPAGDGGSPITGYTVATYRDGLLVKTNTAPAGATSLTVTGLTNGRPHTFTVTATNAVGTSAASASSAAVVPVAAVTLPAAPRIGTPAPGIASAVVRWAAPLSNGGSPVTGYTVRAYRGTSVVATVRAASTATGATVKGLANGTAYTFLVTATNAVGEGPASARSATVVPRTVPSAPRITRVAAGRSTATVLWAAPANGGAAITSYVVRVYRGSALVRTVKVSGSTTRLTVPGLTPGVGHSFTIYAVNAAGNGYVSARSATVVPLR